MSLVITFAPECLNIFGLENLNWPKVDEKYLKSDERIIVIQINWKKKYNYDYKRNGRKELIAKIKEMKLLINILIEIEIIYIKNKLINIIIT